MSVTFTSVSAVRKHELNNLFSRFAGDLKVMSSYALFWNI